MPPKNATPPTTHISTTVAARVRRHRHANGWSREDLAAKMTANGHPMEAPVIGNIETGRPDETGRRRRQVTVDELCSFAALFGIPAAELLAPEADCDTCGGAPPAGFRCTECDRVGATRKIPR